jgi:WD40 repeat protein
VRSATFTKDGRLVLTGSEDKTTRLWDVATAKPVGPPFQNTSKVRRAVVSPNGKLILAGTDDGAWIWNLPAPLNGPLTDVVLWAQILTSMELDKTGVAHPSKTGIWQQRRRVVDQLGESLIPPP